MFGLTLQELWWTKFGSFSYSESVVIAKKNVIKIEYNQRKCMNPIEYKNINVYNKNCVIAVNRVVFD